jgi:transcription antitermination factor NusG
MTQRTAYWGGRKRQVLSPIFPSCVFFSGDQTAVYHVMATNRVCQTIPVRQRAYFVSELDAIDIALKCNPQLDLYPFATIGRRCRVRQGPLTGIEGKIVQVDGATRLVLQVSMLGQGVALEISPDLLEPID